MSKFKTSLLAFSLLLTTSATSTFAANISVNLLDPQYTQLNDLRPSNYVSTAVNLLFGASGVAAFIFLLWGGFQWITAGGDKDAVEKARKKIMTALVGLAIVFSAYTFLYIIQVLFNINIIQVDFRPLTG